MTGYLQLIMYTFVLYLCIYGVISRICKCIEHRTEWKYRARADLEWVNAQRLTKSWRTSDRKEGNQGV